MTAPRYRPFDGDEWLGRDLPLAEGTFRVLPETAFEVAQEMAFARQGRKARVFKLRGPDGAPYALKTFYRGFSLPEYAPITRALPAFGDIRGLRACRRRLITADEADALGEPGLVNAVLMPWIEGVAWAGVVESRFPLEEATCLSLAQQTAATLAAMEARRLTHADVSSSNVLVTVGPAVEFIDVEDMYHDSFGPLPYVPDGSPGYAHPANQGRGCRNEFGDRFAAAILLTEMLVWPDPSVRRSAGDVSLFEQAALGRRGLLHDLVVAVLRTRSAEAADLFERAWHSTGLEECPALHEWAAVVEPLAPGGLAVGVLAPVTCPGCGREVIPGHRTARHATRCPLRPASTVPLQADRSTFPGVPGYDGIGFVPLFD
jgi:hypothetical protein